MRTIHLKEGEAVRLCVCDHKQRGADMSISYIAIGQSSGDVKLEPVKAFDSDKLGTQQAGPNVYVSYSA